MKRLAAFAVAAMVSCSPIPETPTRGASLVRAMPNMNVFASSVPVPATRANAEIAKDFIDLSFQMESGRALPTLTRFEGPITVRVTGPATDTLLHDLAPCNAQHREPLVSSSRGFQAGKNICKCAELQPSIGRH